MDVGLCLINPLKRSGNYAPSTSAFFPRSVFVGSTWFLQQTAITSLNSINELMFIMVCFLLGKGWSVRMIQLGTDLD
jgi:hypothetical protein